MNVVFPWGKYKYKYLPIEIKISPDAFQNIMSKIVQDIDHVKTSLDDLLILRNICFKDHIIKLEAALEKLSKAGMRVNASKSKFSAEK